MGRLNKELARTGIGSRREADSYICNGRVAVNGEVVKTPWLDVDLAKDRVEVDGKPLEALEPFRYYILNKPSGYVCSNKREKHKRIVSDLFEEDERLFTVGRLDKASTGLLLVTNDGDFSNRVIHPKSGLKKEYIVKTNREITHDHLVAIGKGVEVQGTYVVPKVVKKIRRGTVKIVVGEGKKHEVRILVKNAGLEVLELKRVRIGGLSLGTLPEGAYRELTEKDRKAIFA